MARGHQWSTKWSVVTMSTRTSEKQHGRCSPSSTRVDCLQHWGRRMQGKRKTQCHAKIPCLICKCGHRKNSVPASSFSFSTKKMRVLKQRIFLVAQRVGFCIINLGKGREIASETPNQEPLTRPTLPPPKWSATRIVTMFFFHRKWLFCDFLNGSWKSKDFFGV